VCSLCGIWKKHTPTTHPIRAPCREKCMHLASPLTWFSSSGGGWDVWRDEEGWRGAGQQSRGREGTHRTPLEAPVAGGGCGARLARRPRPRGPSRCPRRRPAPLTAGAARLVPATPSRFSAALCLACPFFSPSPLLHPQPDLNLPKGISASRSSLSSHPSSI